MKKVYHRPTMKVVELRPRLLQIGSPEGDLGEKQRATKLDWE